MKELLKPAEQSIISEVKSMDELCNHYRIPHYGYLNFIDAGEDEKNIILYNNHGKDNTGKGRRRKLSPLRRNFSVVHLVFLFNVCESTISVLITTWINFMYVRHGSISIWPSQMQLRKILPDSTTKKYPHL